MTPVSFINPTQTKTLAQRRGSAGFCLLALAFGRGRCFLLNSLAGSRVAATSGIREDDSKGRHTTRHRALYSIPDGGLLLDSPGMRELGLADVGDGLAATFADISALAINCRFADCAHESEPGCAVQAEVESGALDERRLRNWRKLEREVARNSKTLAQSRAEERAFTQLVHNALLHSRSRKNKT